MATPVGATILSYNGILISNCLTKQFHQEAVYDPSHTDVIHQKFTIRVAGVVHTITNGNANVGIYPNNQTLNVGETNIRQALMDPRQEFGYAIGGTYLLQANPVDAAAAARTSGGGSQGGYNGIDLDNGPKPKRLSIRMTGTASYEVEYEIEVCLLDCANSTNTKGVISNRWGFTEHVDESGTWTRNYYGILRVAQYTIDPQEFRAIVVPPLAQGMKRMSMRFNTTPDMLVMQYEISDVQVQAAAPYPATSWSGLHSVETSDGVHSYADCSLTLTGEVGFDKRNLISLAMRILNQKLNLTTQSSQQQAAVVIAAKVTDHMQEPTIDAHARVMLYAANPAQYLNVDTSTLGQPVNLPGYNFMQSTTPKNYPVDSPAALFVCYMQSRCDDDHSITGESNSTGGTGGQANAGSGGGSGYQQGNYQGPTTSTSTSATIPVDATIPSNYSSDQKGGNFYTFMQMDNRYPVRGQLVQLPIASVGNASNVSQGIGYIPGGGGVPFPVSSTITSGGSYGSGSSTLNTCVVAPLGQSTCKRYLKVLAERVGDWPDVPTPENFSTGSNLTGYLNDFSIDPRSPKLLPDGKTKFFSVSAEYEWLLNRVPSTSDKLDVGALAFTSMTPAKNLIAANQLLSANEII